jgi:hypothetical protein
VEHFEQLGDVVEVQSSGRLVKNIERAAGGAFAQLLGEFDALGFAAGQRRRLLTDVDIAQADALQRLEGFRTRGTALKKSAASSTVISSTSAMDLPLNRTSRVSRL